MFFQSVSSDLSKLDRSLFPPRPYYVPDEYIIPVLEVEKQLMKLDTKKGSRPDNIPKWVLRDFLGISHCPSVIFSTQVSGKAFCPMCGKMLLAAKFQKIAPQQKIETDLRPISLT